MRSFTVVKWVNMWVATATEKEVEDNRRQKSAHATPKRKSQIKK